MDALETDIHVWLYHWSISDALRANPQKGANYATSKTMEQLMNSPSTLLVSIIDGPYVQGDGKLIGKNAIRISLAGCDSSCQWCDSPRAVDVKRYGQLWRRLPVGTIVARVCQLMPAPCWVVLTGGNPALHMCNDLIASLHVKGYRVAVETQGTVAAYFLERADMVAISPTPPSANVVNGFKPAKIRRILELCGDKAYFKVPILNEDDLHFAERLYREFPHVDLYLTSVNVDTQIRAFDSDERQLQQNQVLKHYRWLSNASRAFKLGDVAIMPRLDVITWGNK